MNMTSTYSPDDNKLRLYTVSRLDPETYARVKAAGFAWAPKQELFVAPAWTPDREDLLIELAGEIDDEDTTLTERAEERADRFEDYGDRRMSEANSAHAAVERIADGIPFGQPILVGHHSERRARKDAEKIENGMRRAVKLWETSKYWADRAKGALRHAKYKELPAVRARRIKTIEADKRKAERSRDGAAEFIAAWSKEGLTKERAMAIANYDHISMSFPLDRYPRELPASQYEGTMGLWSAMEGGVITAEQARDLAIPAHERTIARQSRWIDHYENRLTYERAMLGEQGGTVADRSKPEKGGAIRCWASPGHGKGWSYVKKVNKVSVTVEDNWGNGGRNFTRTIEFDKIKAVMSKAGVDEAKSQGRVHESFGGLGFFLDEPAETRTESNERVHLEAVAAAKEKDSAFAALKDTLKAGVKVVSAPQLFPTPPELASRVVELAEIHEGHRILEPSAGTGSLIRAIQDVHPDADITAVEINRNLADGVSGMIDGAYGVMRGKTHCTDFLETDGELGTFDRIVMNPPFAGGSDIKHVRHALGKLNPGGRLVAIVANGPRQREALMPSASEWYDLEPGSFADSGTNVNAAIVVFDL